MTRPYHTWRDPANVALLGAMPDAEVARRLGLQTGTVGTVRRKRGIPAYVPPKREPAPKPPRRKLAEQLPQAIRQQLGQESDMSLAVKAGVSERVIRDARAAAGIRPFGPVRRPAGAIELPALPDPTPANIVAARAAAGHNNTQASRVARLQGIAAWGKYENGEQGMDLARWELYLLLTGQHPTLRVVKKEAA